MHLAVALGGAAGWVGCGDTCLCLGRVVYLLLFMFVVCVEIRRGPWGHTGSCEDSRVCVFTYTQGRRGNDAEQPEGLLEGSRPSEGIQQKHHNNNTLRVSALF